MPPRPYQLGKRAATLAATRARILAAARDLLTGERAAAAAMGEVARRAGVTRATVYAHFGSKAGLLEAVLDDSERRGGRERVLEAAAIADAADATRRAFEQGSRLWAADHVVARNIFALAAIDAEIAQIVATRSANRLALVTALAQRLAAQHRLRPGCTVDHAVDALWLLSSFEAFDQLFSGRGLDADTVARNLFELLERAVLCPERRQV